MQSDGILIITDGIDTVGYWNGISEFRIDEPSFNLDSQYISFNWEVLPNGQIMRVAVNSDGNPLVLDESIDATITSYISKILDYKSSISIREDAAKSARSYREKRVEAYIPLGDQLDMIIKTFKKLSLDGIDIGADGSALIAMSESVKNQFPSE
jgi:hypothetical protein